MDYMAQQRRDIDDLLLSRVDKINRATLRAASISSPAGTYVRRTRQTMVMANHVGVSEIFQARSPFGGSRLGDVGVSRAGSGGGSSSGGNRTPILPSPPPRGYPSPPLALRRQISQLPPNRSKVLRKTNLTRSSSESGVGGGGVFSSDSSSTAVPSNRNCLSMPGTPEASVKREESVVVLPALNASDDDGSESLSSSVRRSTTPRRVLPTPLLVDCSKEDSSRSCAETITGTAGGSPKTPLSSHDSVEKWRRGDLLLSLTAAKNSSSTCSTDW